MKPNIHLKSIFEQISEEVFKMRDLNEAKKFVTEFVQNKNINDKDKQSIINEVNNAKNLVRFQTYICNALLKFEGLGVAQLNKISKESAAGDTSLETA